MYLQRKAYCKEEILEKMSYALEVLKKSYKYSKPCMMSSAAEGTVSSSLIQAGCNVAVTQQPNWTRFHNQKRKKLMSWNFLLAEKARLQPFC